MKHFLVAIDGPAGAGKSTVARRVADHLEITYVDTGAMYRSIAWKLLREKVNAADEAAVTQLAESMTFALDPAGICVDGTRLTDEIRTPQVTALASTVAKMAGVRRALVRKQQEIAERQSVVMDGRDIGTHVLPHADVKIFLTASIEERARRRYKELLDKGISADLESLKEDICRRDENDRTRQYAPLRQAEDAILIDTTNQSISEAVEVILQLCRNKLGGEE
ncbi:(d)CMP kinase [Paenactinomyces guangxiensis]|uniref:Cytidylate kinase n=1 Tax=Paenactinomyces guangxiensis TaxID=1490290 RepID=A0A7W1WT90_9BACL|nr:(d)CMP kinase [Paenactinomyces guangxiensis]MBA4495624.1 (d)CMP kinase [Paenactinomyces guangxiensis]MBH8592612.1 (d)CMP kinase [Paenactinomyces guangxiensis]